MKKSLLLLALSFGCLFTASARSPFSVPDDPQWIRAGSDDDIRASGTVYQCTDDGESEMHIVFFHRVTPHNTRSEHIAFFKEFLGNIQQAYPNVIMTYAQVLGEEVPFISVFDPEGNTFFWGALYHHANTYEIAVTAEGRHPTLPHQVTNLLSRISLPD
ncbi:MAG: hypothetical protein PHP44_14650 [Kiritimatiellae bacterium]|nr:hypothetical protein [Kiritimatiellia bacterium]